MSQNNGFLIVATKHKCYLSSAIYLADSLIDYYPDAKITLYAEKDWEEDIPYDLFDNVVLDNFNHHRTKLYALSQTPYDLTAYLDADMVVESEEVSTIFDQITDDVDMMMTNIRGYNSKISQFEGGELKYHCGMFLYRKTPKVIKFMEEWWKLYQKQMTGEWVWDTDLYPEELRPWDQWSFWWLQNQTDLKINVGIFDDDAKWNFVTGYKKEESKTIILRHERLMMHRSE